MSRIEGAIAATRFGMGARPGEIASASSDPRGWLKAQIRTDAAIIPAGSLRSTQQVFDDRREDYAEMMSMGGQSGAAPATTGGRPEKLTEEQRQALQKRVAREIREGLVEEADARSKFAASTSASFAERWARFWANHFTVAGRSQQTAGLAGPYEREAIRGAVFGSFRNLLHSAVLHPGMLVFLDAHRSIGPSTRAAERRGAGLNENLAREVLELHTMGVGSGYTQADIIEFAKALTGWTVPAGPGAPGARPPGGKAGGKGDRRPEPRQIGAAIFIDPLHEPGARTVLGKRYAEGGPDQAKAILDDLAKRPETARHVAVKLARHFVADEPPANAVDRLDKRFRDTNGNLAELAKAVIDLDDAWRPEPQKFKTPEELLVSVARGADQDMAYGRDRRAVYESLGQPPYGAPSPAGWPDIAANWTGPDAIKKRLEWANAASVRVLRGKTSPVAFLDEALGPLADARTREAVSRAESAEQGFTLALMSPAFQRR